MNTESGWDKAQVKLFAKTIQKDLGQAWDFMVPKVREAMVVRVRLDLGSVGLRHLQLEREREPVARRVAGDLAVPQASVRSRHDVDVEARPLVHTAVVAVAPVGGPQLGPNRRPELRDQSFELVFKNHAGESITEPSSG